MGLQKVYQIRISMGTGLQKVCQIRIIIGRPYQIRISTGIGLQKVYPDMYLYWYRSTECLPDTHHGWSNADEEIKVVIAANLQLSKVPSSKPEEGQNIALRASPAVGNFPFFCLLCSFTFIFKALFQNVKWP